MRKGLVLLGLLVCSIAPAAAQVSVGVGFSNANVAINIATYPELVPVPGYPVYYAPRLSANYFFYDGMYWLFDGENWYASTWYNGPWELVAPEFVPLFVLRVPVAYYRRPPVYFSVWGRNAPPHWGEHWGASWESQRIGWDRWDRASVPAPAPLPVYQRQYSGSRYPRVEQQQALQTQNYRYQPRDAEVQRQYHARAAQTAPVTGSNVIRNPAPQTAAPVTPQPPRQANAERRTPPPPQAATRTPAPPREATAQHPTPPPPQAAARTPAPSREATAQHPTPPPPREAIERHPTPPPQASVQRSVEPRQAAVAHPAPAQTMVQHAPPQTAHAAPRPEPGPKPTIAQNPAPVAHPATMQQHAEPRSPQVASRAEHPMPKEHADPDSR